jgi:hypothetical protein
MVPVRGAGAATVTWAWGHVGRRGPSENTRNVDLVDFCVVGAHVPMPGHGSRGARSSYRLGGAFWVSKAITGLGRQGLGH